jgi:hypothetical protein
MQEKVQMCKKNEVEWIVNERQDRARDKIEERRRHEIDKMGKLIQKFGIDLEDRELIVTTENYRQ